MSATNICGTKNNNNSKRVNPHEKAGQKKEDTHYFGEDVSYLNINNSVIGEHSTVKVAYSVFVEEVENHVGQSGVAPVPVDQQKFLEIPETWESKVARHHRLQNTRRTRQSIPSIPAHRQTTCAAIRGNNCWKSLARFTRPASL